MAPPSRVGKGIGGIGVLGGLDGFLVLAAIACLFIAGSINADQTMPTNDPGRTAPAEAPKQQLSRELLVTANYLQLPVVNRKDGHQDLEELRIEADGKLLRYLHVEFPTQGEKPDYWYSWDLREFKGRIVTLRYKSRDPEALNQLALGDKEISGPNAYATGYRPQFHFSPRVGWMNDINGSYYQNGLYHIFFQYNPASTTRGAGFDMHWGHAVSKDLVHWEEWPVALFPNAAGQCYSGTTLMQKQAVPGLNAGVKLPAPVIFFAATTPFSQHIATSPDGGYSWTRFAGNPVVPNMGDDDRDPKVFWHAPSEHYIMVLYVGGPDTYRILRSKDLIHWEQTCVLPSWYECPEFFPVKSAINGQDLMLLYGSYHTPKGAANPINFSSCYQLGHFDGKVFAPVTNIRQAHLGPSFYAALVFTNAPKSRHIMMGWAAGTQFPGENFNQCASIPLELSLRVINGEDTLCFEPVKELDWLRGHPLLKLSHVTVAEANAKLQGLAKDSALDIVLRLRPSPSGTVAVTVRNAAFTYDPVTKLLSLGDRSKTLHPGATLDARFLIDHGIVESFWNSGEA
ncbi:MAG TPA: glycoside hydrolase family 32 protein, partial [Capsulimonadaceae bacterium]|nr:glycoside hydrolase family 32 protein [Capsulimonadaceae bacterium]